MKKQIILLMLITPIMVLGLGSDTVKKIDIIENNTATDITLKPDASVKVDTFIGNFVLQSGAAKEIEESTTTNTELGYLSGVTSSIQTQIDSKENILPLTTSGDILYHNGANLARLAVGTPGQLFTVNAGSVGTWQDPPSQSPTTTLGDLIYHNGAGDVALNIGTDGQLLTVFSGSVAWKDAPVSTTLNTKGDLQGYSTVNAKVPVGTDGQVLSADSSEATGVKWIAPPASSPTTTLGDMIYHGGGGSDVRLPLGTNNQVLISNSVTPQYSDISPLLNMPFKGDLLVGNGVSSGTSNFNIGGNGSFLIADSNEALGMKWSDTLSGIFNPVTDWKPFTPTGSWTTNTTYTGQQRRVGDTLEVNVLVSLSGAPNSATLEVNLPDGLSIDVTKLSLGSTIEILGDVISRDNSVGNILGKVVYVGTPTSIRPTYFVDLTNLEQVSSINQAVPFTFAVNDEVWFTYKVPIVGWTSGTDAIAQNKVPLYGRYYRTGAQSSIVTNATILFNTKDNGNIDAHFNTSTGEFTTPDDRCYEFSSGVTFLNAATDSRPYINLRINGVDSVYSSDGVSPNTNTLHNLSSGVICLNANDVVRVDIFTGTGLSRDVSGGKPTFFSIKEYAEDYTIVAPIDSQKWECQTKRLSADVTSTGAIADLAFNNLEIGKKYKIFGKLWCRENPASSVGDRSCAVTVSDGTTVVTSDFNETTHSGPTNFRVRGSLIFNDFFISGGTTLTTTMGTLSAEMKLSGSEYPTMESITLCQIPDNYNLTSTKWN